MSSPSTVALEVLTGAVAFTDICGFTEFTAVRGDEEAFNLLATQARVVEHCLPAEGRVVKELGDGLLLWFPDAAAALTTSLDLQDAFAEEAFDADLPLWVRIGVHWGQQTKRGDDLIGHDVNIAARVVDVAGPAEVVVTEALRDKLATPTATVEFEELGPVVMKGLPDPVRLFRASRDLNG